MKRLFLQVTSIFLFSLMLGSCGSPMLISRGTSFGHCRGYCNKEVKLFPQKAVFAQSKNGDDPAREEKVSETKRSDYEKAVKALDLAAFQQLAERIGCPDCADGGAEWIEVQWGKERKRVTFEFGRAPEELKAVAEQLKAIQDKFEDNN